jgi:hypothetical protein
VEAIVPSRRLAVPSRVFAALALAGSLVVGPALVAPAVFDACAAADGTTVAVVVDFGTVAGSPGNVAVRCVPPGSPNTGAQTLADAGFTMRYAPSGLLCAIDGHPASGCGERTASGEYHYWAYWRATGGATSWSYAPIGPAASRVGAGDVEGWRFVSSTETAAAGDQPRRAPVHATLCGSTGPAPDRTGSGAPPAPPPAAARPPGAAGASPSASADPAAPDTSGGDGPSEQPAEAAAGDLEGRDGEGNLAAPGSRRAGETGDPAADDVSDGEQAMGRPGDGGSAGPWGLVAVAVVVIGLATAATVRFRRPTAER